MREGVGWAGMGWVDKEDQGSLRYQDGGVVDKEDHRST